MWTDIVVAAVGPTVAFLLGFGAAEWITARAQSRRRRADMRDDFAAEMYDVAGLLYFELQAFWRRAETTRIRDRRQSAELEEAVSELDRIYANARRRGKILEQRLLVYFASREPAQRWHRVMDLLAARYFLLLEADEGKRSEHRRKNAGEQHSGLSAEALDDPTLLLAAYRSALPESVASLWQFDLDWQGKHIRTSADVTTWSASLNEAEEENAGA